MKKYLWQNEAVISKMKKGDSGAVDFVTNMMNQNLDHARHLENERLSYCACVTALVAGVFAFNDSVDISWIRILYIILFFIIGLSWILTERWSAAFDRHIIYAKGCYYMLQASILGDAYDVREFDQLYVREDANKDTSRENLRIPVISRCNTIEDIYPLKNLPLYSFKVDNPRRIPKKTQTICLFRAYYIILLLIVFIAFIYTFFPQAVIQYC